MKTSFAVKLIVGRLLLKVQMGSPRLTILNESA